MATYYVATLSRYVLVEATDESDARTKGQSALYDLYAEQRQRLGREVPIEVRTVRPATAEEIDLGKWHQEMCRQEEQMHASNVLPRDQ